MITALKSMQAPYSMSHSKGTTTPAVQEVDLDAAQ